ncbi:PH domain-containing protein [Pilimelia columellifera]|uniref:PH domain-containing protein n=1 Tax=Pilimelia columellifera subsp. columellifera TaxID=706583 RepID=A0ABP6ATN9_9ACTN
MSSDGATDPFEAWPEGVAWRSVSPRLAVVLLIRLWVGALVLGALVVAVVTLTGLALSVGWALTVISLLTLLRSATIVRAVRAWGYAERDRDLLVRHGLWVKQLSIVPYARMQFVDVSAGPVERAFGLATVELHTAAAASDAEVPGLVAADARRLRDRLTELGADRTAGL